MHRDPPFEHRSISIASTTAEMSKLMNNETKKEQPGDSARHAPRVVKSSQLFNDRKEIFIQHGDQLYLLKITRQDKLILTK